MRKSFLLIVSALVAMGAYSQEKNGIYFHDITFDQALEKAKNNMKGPNLVFLDCYTEWCGPCKQMANVEFVKLEAGNFFNSNFINIKKDMEKGEGVSLAVRYAVTAFPTFLILDKDGKEIGRIVGGDKIESFILKTKKAMDPSNSPEAKKAVYLASRTVQNALAYMEVLESGYMEKQMAVFMDEEFANFEDYELFSDKMWPYFARALSVEGGKSLLYTVKNAATISNYVGKQRVDKALVSAYNSILMAYLSGKRDLPKEEVISISEKLLLLSVNDEVSVYTSKIARLYTDCNMNEILNLYSANNLVYMSVYDSQALERIFAGIKGMPKENIVKYYKEKEKLLKELSEQCANWMEMFTK
ncbi:MAG: hypothetical protein A2X18_02575 [Bacteroidetes bacterium GWF2_40_14]|nr:MAG: hypothetical protein A2X18_02575 [Bacteroidetes bacterium GWF2_40_14]